MKCVYLSVPASVKIALIRPQKCITLYVALFIIVIQILCSFVSGAVVSLLPLYLRVMSPLECILSRSHLLVGIVARLDVIHSFQQRASFKRSTRTESIFYLTVLRMHTLITTLPSHFMGKIYEKPVFKVTNLRFSNQNFSLKV